MPQWTWPYNGLIVGLDPVAVDYTGWQIIEKKRAEAGMKSLKEVRRAPTTSPRRRMRSIGWELTIPTGSTWFKFKESVR